MITISKAEHLPFLKQRPGGTRKWPINNSKEKVLMGARENKLQKLQISQNEKLKSYA